ncbi:MAG TPA: GNAT family N-acetyltransferase [Saprospiraceae bacterium]|nr:GNAT family N-acetyltransferase [Saprospiraceae bacterium]
MEFEIKILGTANLEAFTQLLDVFDIVFEYEASPRPDDAYLERLLNKDSFIVIVAMQEDTVIAGLTAYVLDQYHSTLPVLYVQDLAVMHDFQRKGVGSKLMEYVVRYARDHGFQQMFIQAELEDDYAVEFYRKTKPTGELMAVHFYYDT